MTDAMTTAVITGSARGIGREMALALARPGTRIVLADIDDANETRALVEARGGEALTVRCDVSSSDDVKALVDRAEDWLGTIDLWVNNAGVLVAGQLSDLSLDDYRHAINVNLWGVVHGCHHVVPVMLRRGGGRILNVASLAGSVTLPQMGAYNATKAAVIALSETLHAELRAKSIAVTVLCPSFTRTNLLDASTGAATDSTMSAARKLMRLMGQTPRQVAEIVLEASRAGKLYAVPAVHARMAWRAKRLMPQGFTRALGVLHRAVQRFA
jgi:NAD(P)-dependent dehydrogenase (short-subunit alcohol dehydrogenase family)